MTRANGLVGLTVSGRLIKGEKALLERPDIVIVATSRAALGKKLNKFCTPGFGVTWEIRDDLIDVVIGDPYLLRDVKVVAKGRYDEIEIPYGVRETFSRSTYTWNQLVVFENKDGSRVYVVKTFAAPLEKARRLIKKRFLRGV